MASVFISVVVGFFFLSFSPYKSYRYTKMEDEHQSCGEVPNVDKYTRHSSKVYKIKIGAVVRRNNIVWVIMLHVYHIQKKPYSLFKCPATPTRCNVVSHLFNLCVYSCCLYC